MIQLYADGSDFKEIVDIYNNRKTNNIRGFNTNPTLMKKSGITDYLSFAKNVLNVVKELPISFEVFADDFDNMKRQAIILSGLAPNVYVKIPVMNTKKEYAYELINTLSTQYNIKLNVTAVFTTNQIDNIFNSLWPMTESIISIFGGRIADTGSNPEQYIKYAINNNPSSNYKILWASPREVYNIYQAENINCDIITATPDLIEKYNKLKDKDLEEYSLETVKMFYNDAKSAGYTL